MARHPSNQDSMPTHSQDHRSALEDSVDFRISEVHSEEPVAEEEMPVTCSNSCSERSRVEEQVQGKGRERRNGERISSLPSTSRS